MKLCIKILLAFLIVGCSSINLDDSWKNPAYSDFNPKNILVVGVTPDFETRSKFEYQFLTELNARNINAIQSAVVFEKLFQDATQTESEIEAQIEKLLAFGYDTVLVSSIKGVQENESLTGASPKFDYKMRKLLGGYLASQEDYFDQNYYKSYKVFQVETAIYSLHKGSEKSLVWSGTYTVIGSDNIAKTTDHFINAVIKSLEKAALIPKKKS